MERLRRSFSILLFSISAYCLNAQESGPLAHIADLRSGVTSHRASSFDKSGGNADAIRIKAGETATLADVPNFYYQIDYQSYADANLTSKQGRFHAQWRSEITRAVPLSESNGVNLDGKNNYLFMHAKGQGQVVGVILAIQGLSSGWWGDGDDMFFIDGATSPATINGTGVEDAFGSAWQFADEFNYPFVGYSSKGNRDWSGVHVMYRFFLEDPIYFSQSIVVGIEHGHANDRRDLYTSVTFWYQKGHQTLDPLPPLKERLPRPFYRQEMLDHDLPN